MSDYHQTQQSPGSTPPMPQSQRELVKLSLLLRPPTSKDRDAGA
jgi:hypothetical protein